VNGSRERDQSVERLLRQSLHTPRPDPVTDSCLDAETLAAWIDGGLSGAALEMAQSHVADCARCQTLVGALARINAVVPLAEHERAPRRWLAWLVPLTAAAAAVALWVAVPRDPAPRLLQATEAQRQAAATKAQTPASQDDRPQTRASEPARGKEAHPAAQASGKDARRPSPAVSGDAARNDAAPRDQAQAQASELRRETGQPEANRSKQSVVGGIAGSPNAVAAVAAPPPPAAKALGLARSAERGAEAPVIDIVSPDPSVRWRIARSVVQRSTDGGSRWDDVPTGLAAELTAGAAPSPSVCWVVGRGGVVLLSADGRTWRRVAFPEVTDLSAIRATDARTASVSTADGRTFSTTDAGATWVLR
jgi:hypothetical protein